MIEFEKEAIDYLGLPSIPKKEFDGHTPFSKGIAVLELFGGEEAYAICAFDPEKGHTKPKVTKVFRVVPFTKIKRIFVVPNYMSTIEDVGQMDLDDESKKRAEQILKEAEEIENEGVEENSNTVPIDTLPEWIFPEIENKEQAEAWIRQYNSRNRIKGKIPSNEDTIKLRLYSIYIETRNKNK